MDKSANIYTANVISLHGHTRPVTKLRYTPDGDYLITCSTDGYTHMWSGANGKFIQSFGPIDADGNVGTISHGQGTAVADFSITSDAEYIAIAYLLDFIAIYKVTAMNTHIKTYTFSDIKGFSSIQYSRDGRRLFAGGKQILGVKAGLMIIDAANPADMKCIKAQYLPIDVTCISLSPMEDYITVGFDNGAVQLFSTETLEPYEKLSTPIFIGNGPIMSIQLYNDTIFSICCSDKKIAILGAKTLQLLKKISTEYPVHCCAIHPNIPNLMVYAGGMDTKIVTQTTHIENTFKLFFIDIAQDVKLGGIQVHVGPVHGLAFSTNGEDLISCSEDSTAFLIKVGKGLNNYTFLK